MSMILGQKDVIDQLLIDKYQDVKMNNIQEDKQVFKQLDPEKYYDIMDFVAINNRFSANI